MTNVVLQLRSVALDWQKGKQGEVMVSEYVEMLLYLLQVTWAAPFHGCSLWHILQHPSGLTSNCR